MPTPEKPNELYVRLKLDPRLIDSLRLVAQAKGLSIGKLIELWVIHLIKKNSSTIEQISALLNQLELE